MCASRPAGRSFASALSSLSTESLTHLRIREQEQQKQQKQLTQAEAQTRAEARREFESELAAISSANSTSKGGAGGIAVAAKVAEAKSMLLQNRQQLASMADTTAEMAAGAQDFATMAAQLNRRP